MIELTRLNGQAFAINPDFIERIDITPDTVITLVEGTKYVVAESLEDITERICLYRARIVSRAAELERPPSPGLRLVRNADGAGE